MLYTRNGDGGQTNLFGCVKKFSKNSPQVETLGALDELNSLLGVCKIKATNLEAKRQLGRFTSKLLEDVQNDLFVIQAEVAGGVKKIKKNRTVEIEKIINKIEKELPKQKNFSVPGGTELSAMLDYSRAVARRAERRFVSLGKGKKKNNPESLKYLNRLSSLLFALARQVNYKSGIKERRPKY